MKLDLSFHRFHEIYERLKPILNKHSDEINEFGDGSKLDLLEDAYLTASQGNGCWVLAAEKNHRIIGYLLFFINQSPHRKNILEGNEDAFYIEKEHRGIGVKMMEEFEKFLKTNGVKRVSFSVPIGRMKRMLPRKGYKPTYEIYVKEI